MTEWIEDILNKGGELAIKKNANDDIQFSVRVKIDDGYYHKALLFSNVQKIFEDGKLIAGAFLTAIRRKREELTKTDIKIGKI